VVGEYKLSRTELNLPGNRNVSFQLLSASIGDENMELYRISNVTILETGIMQKYTSSWVVTLVFIQNNNI